VIISHREIAKCEANPQAWVRARKGDSTFYGFGYNQVLVLGIYRFHRTGSASQARSYLQDLLTRHSARLRTTAKAQDVLGRFDSYRQWMAGSQTAVAEHRVRLNAQMGGFLSIGGEISRVDVTGPGYRGVILGSFPSDWRDELRMPLIQLALALRYQRPAEQFSVGVQELDGSSLAMTSYSLQQIEAARAEFRALGSNVRQIW
jgi:hypothetical protein